MLATLLLLGLTAVQSPGDADAKVQASLDFMKLSYACRDHGGLYKSAKNIAVRRVQIESPATTFKVETITSLDRDLKSGAEKTEVDTADCENLLIEGKAKLDATQ